MAPLTNRVAVVTGASSGIGAATALRLAQMGATVNLVGRSEDRLRTVAEQIVEVGGLSPATRVVDFQDRRATRAFVNTVLPALSPDILVNSAGRAESLQQVHRLNFDEWEMEILVNLTVPAMLCSAVLPGMRARSYGFIVNIASEAGVTFPPGMGGYCVSKHGLVALSELIQVENQEFGVKCWAVCPGEVATGMADWQNGHPDRFLAASDVADLTGFLLSQSPTAKMGPVLMLRTTLNPFEGTPREQSKEL